jgi:hypothetical protein
MLHIDRTLLKSPSFRDYRPNYRPRRGRGLGQDSDSILSELGSVLSGGGGSDSSVGSTALSTVQGVLSQLGVGSSSGSWIPAQNQAASILASIVSNYSAVKATGNLTGPFIAAAVNQVNNVNLAFQQYVQSNFPGSAGALAGVQSISSNAMAIVANMNLDAAAVGATLTTSVSPTTGQSTVTSGTSTTTMMMLAAAAVALFFFSKKGKGIF